MAKQDVVLALAFLKADQIQALAPDDGRDGSDEGLGACWRSEAGVLGLGLGMAGNPSACLRPARQTERSS